MVRLYPPGSSSAREELINCYFLQLHLIRSHDPILSRLLLSTVLGLLLTPMGALGDSRPHQPGVLGAGDSHQPGDEPAGEPRIASRPPTPPPTPTAPAPLGCVACAKKRRSIALSASSSSAAGAETFGERHTLLGVA